VDERLKTNLAHWNDAVAIHERSDLYRVAEFKAGRNSLRSTEIEEVGDVRGKSLLHLQCHFGLDTMSWARLGARVTGIDFSDKAIALARSIATELKLDARFICTPLGDAPRALDERFDIVFTSYGALCWLPDLAAWARTAAHFVKPGGVFYIAEFHPLTQSFDIDHRTELRPRISYFHSAMQEWPPEPDYADRKTMHQHGCHEWMYTTAGVVTALIDAGLQIEFLHEFPRCMFKIFQHLMESDGDGWWRIPGDPIPLVLSIRAHKPLA
jgi:SAM-dependent methyltransferase